MRPTRHLTIVAALLPLLSVSVEAHEADCEYFDDLSPQAPITAAIVIRRRAHFVKNRSDKQSCPSDAAVCREKAYVVKADEVIVTQQIAGFVCAVYPSNDQTMMLGWLPAAAVAQKPPDRARNLQDWLGEWAFRLRKPRYRAQEITIAQAEPGGSALRIKGHASFASSAAAANRGAVNVGEIDAEIVPAGAALSFTQSEDKTLPYDQGEEDDCRIRMRLVDRFLLVGDNGNCGGQNVSFWGIYRRIAPVR